MAENEEEKEKEKVQSSGGLLPVINLVLLVLVLAVGGFIAWTLVNMEQAPPAEQAAVEQTEETVIPEAEDEPVGPPVIMEIEDITVNLADTDANRFLRTKIKLELRNEEAKAKIKAKIDALRDLMLTTLRSKKFSDIRTPQGTYALKEELIVRMNRVVGGKPIKNLYFTDFVSQ